MIARNQTIEMPFYCNLALDNGVKPRELSEIITHLAFYSGWPNAMSAVVVAKDLFAQRGIGSDQLPARSPELVPLNPSAEAQRVTSVDQQLGSGFPGLVQYTTDVLFRDLWLRPDLTPRDRSLVTVRAPIASGQFAQLSGHLTRAMNNGLTQAQSGGDGHAARILRGMARCLHGGTDHKDGLRKALEPGASRRPVN